MLTIIWKRNTNLSPHFCNYIYVHILVIFYLLKLSFLYIDLHCNRMLFVIFKYCIYYNPFYVAYSTRFNLAGRKCTDFCKNFDIFLIMIKQISHQLFYRNVHKLFTLLLSETFFSHVVDIGQSLFCPYFSRLHSQGVLKVTRAGRKLDGRLRNIMGDAILRTPRASR